MSRLVVLGIDGMDPDVFEGFRGELPHLSALASSGGYRRCASVFPPDSIPAWVTIFTGEYPEKHGWLDNIDYEDIRKGAMVGKRCDLQGRTFWDRVGQAEKRVCVINPLLAYPVWPVNGIMASGPVFITGEKQVYPADLSARYVLPELGGMTDFPADSQLEQFLEQMIQSTRELADFGLALLKSEPWDLFFISFFTLDRIQHFLWRFCDRDDPLYPGITSLEGGIAKAYKAFDEIVGQFMGRIGGDAALVVLSDHGHGRRPTMLVNLNEALRQADLLKSPRELTGGAPIKKGVEITKNASVRLVVDLLGERWLYRIARLLPRKVRKQLKKSSYLIDKKASTAWLSEIGGGASVGGIDINPKLNPSSDEYRAAVASVLECLERLNQEANEQVIQWAKPRQDASCYPDVIIEFQPNLAAGRSLFCPLLERNPRHRIISGGHKKEGVLFAHNCNLAASVGGLSDIAGAVIAYVLNGHDTAG
jgi:predicted AlkP superfamily phosphohydrolase/phosphomutase